MIKTWNTGDVIVSRGIFRNKVWSAVPAIVVNDCHEELLLTVLPGTECAVEETYSKGKHHANRLWDFKTKDWRLAPFQWHTSRLLILHKPNTFYSIRLFWQQSNNKFLGYYVNFQLPYQRSHWGIDTRDLELDIDIDPDFSFAWKDLDDYQKGIETGIILSEWVAEIESAKIDILGRLQKRRYPFDGSWLDWRPKPGWSLPTLPENWDKI